MKLIQMLYSPNAFENFIKQKLEEVEVDSSLSDQYWNKMDITSVKTKGTRRKNFLYVACSTVLLTVIIFIAANNFSKDKLPIKEKGSGKEIMTPSIPYGNKPLHNNNPKQSPEKKYENKVKKKQIIHMTLRGKADTAFGNNKTIPENISKATNDIKKTNSALFNIFNDNLVKTPPVVLRSDSVTKIANDKLPIEKKKKSPVHIIW